MRVVRILALILVKTILSLIKSVLSHYSLLFFIASTFIVGITMVREDAFSDFTVWQIVFVGYFLAFLLAGYKFPRLLRFLRSKEDKTQSLQKDQKQEKQQLEEHYQEQSRYQYYNQQQPSSTQRALYSQIPSSHAVTSESKLVKPYKQSFRKSSSKFVK